MSEKSLPQKSSLQKEKRKDPYSQWRNEKGTREGTSNPREVNVFMKTEVSTEGVAKTVVTGYVIY